MSGRIHILDDALADQIAAGEVVERPASVVKELLENAIDAGARRIVVRVDGGGRDRIRVSDDGSGMSAQDAELAIQRHATSKLWSRDQLMNITTLGFRGEALPSIASVSEFCLTTRSKEETAAIRVGVLGGAKATVGAVGAPVGTTVDVSRLFFNVPARLKFLKSRATENGHIATTCLRVALAHPQLALTLERDGKRAREFLAVDNRSQRAAQAFPNESLEEIEDSRDGVTMTALLGAPERARSGASGLHLFINGRPVRDSSLARAVSFAYGSVLPPGRYPVGAVWIDLDPSEVDVNVHPQKQEVRFARGRQVFDAVTRMLAAALGTAAWSTSAPRSGAGLSQRGQDYWSQRLTPGPRPEPTNVADRPVSTGTPPQPSPEGGGTPPGTSTPQAASLFEGKGFFGSLRVLGQVRRMLLVCEGADELYVVDQHAADERVRYDALRKAHKGGRMQTQHLLFAERIECSESEATLVEEHASAIQALGLDVSRLGDTTVAIHAVPALLHRAPPERLLRDVITELARSGERAFTDALDMVFATMACHAALRSGDAISNQEAQQLLTSMDAVDDFSGHCPHGRPVIWSMGFDELERRLGR